MKLRTLIVSSLIGLSLAACNAGSSVPTSSATAAPTSVPTIAPFSSVSQSVNAPANTPVTLTSVGGLTPSVTFPVALSGTETTSSVAPTNVSTFSAFGAGRTIESKPNNATTLAYATIVATAGATIPAGGTVSFSTGFPSSLAGSAFYIALFDGTTWHTEFTTTAGTVSGTNVSFTITAPAAVTIAAGQTYGVVLYAVPATATPAPSTLNATSTPGVLATATPTATATATATPFPVASGSVSASAQTISNIVSADGTTATLTLPSISGSTFAYSEFTSTTGLTATGTAITGTTGTFLVGESISSASAISVPAQSLFSFSAVPSATIAGKTLRLYYITSGGTAVQIGTSATASATGVAFTGSGRTTTAFNLAANSTYNVALYYQ